MNPFRLSADLPPPGLVGRRAFFAGAPGFAVEVPAPAERAAAGGRPPAAAAPQPGLLTVPALVAAGWPVVARRRDWWRTAAEGLPAAEAGPGRVQYLLVVRKGSRGFPSTRDAGH